MDDKSYKKIRKEVMDFAKDAIKNKYQSLEQPEDKLWFKNMKQKHHYIAGNYDIVFSVIDIDGRIYMSKIF